MKQSCHSFLLSPIVPYMKCNFSQCQRATWNLSKFQNRASENSLVPLSLSDRDQNESQSGARVLVSPTDTSELGDSALPDDPDPVQNIFQSESVQIDVVVLGDATPPQDLVPVQCTIQPVSLQNTLEPGVSRPSLQIDVSPTLEDGTT